MVRKNVELQKGRDIIPGNYVCSLTLKKAIETIYPDASRFTYPHGQPGQMLAGGRFISFNGRIGEVVYAYCDFTDKKNVPLSSTNRDDLLKLRLMQVK